MTTFAPNFTPRWRGKYVAAKIQHTIQFRTSRGAPFDTINAFAGIAATLFGHLAPNLASDFHWLSAEIALTDSEVFMPATTPSVTIPGAIDEEEWSPMSRIYATTFSGKSSSGRGRVSIFGILLPTEGADAVGGDGVLQAGELDGLGNAVNVLNTSARSAGGQVCTYYYRATYKQNDHLLKLVRRGTIG